MSIVVQDKGKGNVVNIDPAFRESYSGTIQINGNNNEICFSEDIRSSGRIMIVLGNDCSIRIGPRCHVSHNFIFALRASSVSIGSNTTFNGSSTIQLHEPSRVTIGEDCMFSGDTNITTSDMHSIVEQHSGIRLNPASDVIIEDHVWVGARAFILKGCRVGKGSIIGLGAVVTGDVPACAIVAGNPARVVRTGVTWRRDLIAIDQLQH